MINIIEFLNKTTTTITIEIAYTVNRFFLRSRNYVYSKNARRIQSKLIWYNIQRFFPNINKITKYHVFLLASYYNTVNQKKIF